MIEFKGTLARRNREGSFENPLKLEWFASLFFPNALVYGKLERYYMSYDLMVFDIAKAPKTKIEFMSWYKNLTEWGEKLDYDNPSNASMPLQNWFYEMIKIFPPMNGPLAPTDKQIESNWEMETRLTDYCIATEAIYMGFAWSLADEAYSLVHKLAIKHGVGFFDPSSGRDDIFLPDGSFIS